MRYYLLIIPLLVGLMLSSCATIRFGRSTTVTIEAEHPGDIVDILAIGPKETVDLRNITLPFKYKVRHNNLPQRVDIISDNYIYEPFTIGAERKGELIAALSKIFGWGGGLGEMALVGGIGFATGSPDVGLAGIGAGVAIGAPLLAVAYTAETDIPDSKVYLTTSVPIDSVNLYQLQDWNLRLRAIEDVYTLLNEGNYKLSRAKAAFLIESEPSAELYYIKGISSYYLDNHKSALIDLYEALHRLNTVEINPGLREEVLECITAVNNAVAIKKENRKQMWAQIASAGLQIGAEAFSIYQQAELAKYRQEHGISPSGVIIDASKLDEGYLNQLTDLNFAISQVQSKELYDFEQFRRYNKKADGSDYTLDEYRMLQAEAIQLMKEEGYDIIAEQRKQAEEDKKWREQQRQNDKKDWFARYGFDTDANQHSTNTTSATSAINTNHNSQSNSDLSRSKESNEQKLDSKQQFKTEAVSSEDYQKIKSVELYYRDGDKAKKMNISADLYKKGAYTYIKIGNKFYPRMSPNWNRFRNAILYGDRQIYYND